VNSGPVWEDGAWTPLPALQGEVDADICVVGLGGSGLSCIGELLRLDQRVVGLDVASIGGGAAGKNGGILLAGLPSFYHTAAARFGRERVRAVYHRTLAEMDRMIVETPEAIRRVGSLRIADDDAELADCVDQLALMRADGLPGEPYDGPEGRGILIPTDGTFDPLLRCRLLARNVVAAGAQLFERSGAVEIRGDRVRTEHGTVRCRRVVVAVDGCLDTVLPELGGQVRSARLQMLATAPALNIDLPRPVYRRWGYEYWQQLPDRRIALGGLRDRAGDGEWTDAAVVTEAVQLGLEAILRNHLHVTAAITHRWAGVVGYSTSGLPIIDEVRPGVWAIGGYNGTGNVLGALCGRGVAQLAIRGNSEFLGELR
jgi:gamma-glutamylputrescine oxidase